MTILVAFVFFCSKLAEFLHVVFSVIEKRVPVFLLLVFASLYKDAARKTEWFFYIRNILKTKQGLAQKLRDIAKHTSTKLYAKFGAFSTKFTFEKNT